MGHLSPSLKHKGAGSREENRDTDVAQRRSDTRDLLPLSIDRRESLLALLLTLRDIRRQRFVYLSLLS